MTRSNNKLAEYILNGGIKRCPSTWCGKCGYLNWTKILKHIPDMHHEASNLDISTYTPEDRRTILRELAFLKGFNTPAQGEFDATQMWDELNSKWTIFLENTPEIAEDIFINFVSHYYNETDELSKEWIERSLERALKDKKTYIIELLLVANREYSKKIPGLFQAIKDNADNSGVRNRLIDIGVILSDDKRNSILSKAEKAKKNLPNAIKRGDKSAIEAINMKIRAAEQDLYSPDFSVFS